MIAKNQAKAYAGASVSHGGHDAILDLSSLGGFEDGLMAFGSKVDEEESSNYLQNSS